MDFFLQKNEKLNSSRLLSLCAPKCWTNQLHVPVCVRVCVCEGFALGFARQEYWSGLPFLSPGDLSDPGMKSGSPTLQVDSLQFEPPGKPYNSIV